MNTEDKLDPALYVVATPIGNMDDMSGRAAGVLRRADVVACEDTRHSAPLLARVGARGRRVALHDHNEDRAAAQLVDDVLAGQSVALVSDAGTPLVSDPGFPVVQEAIRRGVPVVAIPGPSAVLAALCVSGLSPARFHFVGFLPDRPARRAALLAEVADLSATLVFYAPARELPEVLGALEQALGNRPAAVCRELTKLHEEVRRGPLASLRADPPVLLGEVVLVVAGAPEAPADEGALEQAIRASVANNEPPSAAAKRLAKEFKLARGAVYERLMAAKGAAPSEG